MCFLHEVFMQSANSHELICTISFCLYFMEKDLNLLANESMKNDLIELIHIFLLWKQKFRRELNISAHFYSKIPTFMSRILGYTWFCINIANHNIKNEMFWGTVLMIDHCSRFWVLQYSCTRVHTQWAELLAYLAQHKLFHI